MFFFKAQSFIKVTENRPWPWSKVKYCSYILLCTLMTRNLIVNCKTTKLIFFLLLVYNSDNIIWILVSKDLHNQIRILYKTKVSLKLKHGVILENPWPPKWNICCLYLFCSYYRYINLHYEKQFKKGSIQLTFILTWAYFYFLHVINQCHRHNMF